MGHVRSCAVCESKTGPSLGVGQHHCLQKRKMDTKPTISFQNKPISVGTAFQITTADSTELSAQMWKLKGYKATNQKKNSLSQGLSYSAHAYFMFSSAINPWVSHRICWIAGGWAKAGEYCDHWYLNSLQNVNPSRWTYSIHENMPLLIPHL